MYDVIIIGGGPAGYSAAARAGALGKKALLAERDLLGGVCLNRGCVPTKAFLHAAKLYDHALRSQAFGVMVDGARFEYSVMKARTAKAQDTLRNGIAGMLKRAGAEVRTGAAAIVDAHTVEIAGERLEGANILVATGSRPAMPPIPGLQDNPRAVDSTGLLAAESPAESLTVIGGGVIGIEFACFLSLLGKKVTVLEMLPRIGGAMDGEIAMTVQRRLEGRGVKIHTGAKVERVEGGTAFFTDKTGAAQSVESDAILVATGRAANLEGLGLEGLGFDVGSGCVPVDERARTGVAGVYAAGDVTGRWQLAHFASRQGVVAVNAMFGGDDVCREVAIPAVMYTDPEAAGVGLTEEEAKERGIEARAVKMLLGASGRFLVETDGVRGFVKAVVGADGLLLGMHVAGPYASEMIGAACVMLEKGMRARDIGEIVFPHPTVSEIMKEVMALV